MAHSEDYAKRILKVLLYIEDHLDEDMSMEELAKVASHSPFHFHRIFHRIIGETIHSYIRRLRLEKAAMKLRYTEQPITEIALDSHYETPSAFTRAFIQSINESPRNYRTLYKEVNAMTKKIDELPMIHPEKIEKTTDLEVLFIRRLGEYSQSAHAAWTSMHSFIDSCRLDKSKLRYSGISHDDPGVTSEDKLRYDACILAPHGAVPTGEISRQTLKGGKYALFSHNGSYESLGETFDRIFLKWKPDSKEEFDYTRPCYEEYLHSEFAKSDPSKLVTKISIPLV